MQVVQGKNLHENYEKSENSHFSQCIFDELNDRIVSGTIDEIFPIADRRNTKKSHADNGDKNIAKVNDAAELSLLVGDVIQIPIRYLIRKKAKKKGRRFALFKKML